MNHLEGTIKLEGTSIREIRSTVRQLQDLFQGHIEVIVHGQFVDHNDDPIFLRYSGTEALKIGYTYVTAIVDGELTMMAPDPHSKSPWYVEIHGTSYPIFTDDLAEKVEHVYHATRRTWNNVLENVKANPNMTRYQIARLLNRD